MEDDGGGEDADCADSAGVPGCSEDVDAAASCSEVDGIDGASEELTGIGVGWREEEGEGGEGGGWGGIIQDKAVVNILEGLNSWESSFHHAWGMLGGGACWVRGWGHSGEREWGVISGMLIRYR